MGRGAGVGLENGDTYRWDVLQYYAPDIPFLEGLKEIVENLNHLGHPMLIHSDVEGASESNKVKEYSAKVNARTKGGVTGAQNTNAHSELAVQEIYISVRTTLDPLAGGKFGRRN